MMKLFSFRLLVGDFPVSARFWRETMGLNMTFSDEEIGYAYIEAGSAGLELFDREKFAAALADADPVPTSVAHSAVVTFKVDDVDASYADLVAHGVPSIAVPQDRPLWRARTAHIADPDGYIIELYSSLSESATPTA
jgi:lactoylglutathione lyase